MSKADESFLHLYQMINEAISHGIVHHVAEDEQHEGRTIRLQDRNMLNFGLCSYLGLEADSRLKQGAIDAVNRYGVQFSVSRAYVSHPLCEDAEGLLSQIFDGKPALFAQTTTLGHLSALPILIEPGDAVLVDFQVHNSVQTTVNIVRTKKVHIEYIRNDDMEQLEERIVALKENHRRIWYLCDGIYSMYGNEASLDALERLLNKYDQFHLYIDDAHGMGWIGINGRGFVLSRIPHHDRMIVVTSLSKSFSAGGGAVVFPNYEMYHKVRSCGGPMIFSIPSNPPTLGAVIASAHIHLSDELPALQSKLLDHIRYFNETAKAYGLPLVHATENPIRFIGVGLPKLAYAVVSRLQDMGFYTNIAAYPAVPMRRSGIRITLTNHHTKEDIFALIQAIAAALPEIVTAGASSMDKLFKTFKMPQLQSSKNMVAAATVERSAERGGLSVEHHESIEAIGKEEWNRLLGDRGYEWDFLLALEKTFIDQSNPEDKWSFHYFIVRDKEGFPLLATYCTGVLLKDDILESSAVSMAVEQNRIDDPYYLTSHYLVMGSLLSEGNHLYLDRGGDWQTAMDLFIEAVQAEQAKAQANTIMLRDFPDDDEELARYMYAQGFLSKPMRESNVLVLSCSNKGDYLAGLSKSARSVIRKEVLALEHMFEMDILDSDSPPASEETIRHLHSLYLSVQQRKRDINTFPLPMNLWLELTKSPGWELLMFRIKPEYGGDPNGRPVGFLSCYKGENHYLLSLIGINSDYTGSHHVYRQAFYQAIVRAMDLGRSTVYLGVDANKEKQRYGASLHPSKVYFQTLDHYAYHVLENIKSGLGNRVEVTR
ncbi:aminotransferase class I/II-fold pyridoxal phosphate-dependent enzyme [Paenibacillus sp. GCM10027627]|uniref:aminotransferase class I/II-fold pyridoxal phosphate-dependent enzyme n=1 Tax=unclassified Paenibacillus TaxID=185978 RepID=UPI00362CDDCF